MGRWLLHLEEWDFYLTAQCWVLAQYYCLETSQPGAESRVSQLGLQDHLNWWGNQFSIHQLCCKEIPILNTEKSPSSRFQVQQLCPNHRGGSAQKLSWAINNFSHPSYFFSFFTQKMLPFWQRLMPLLMLMVSDTALMCSQTWKTMQVALICCFPGWLSSFLLRKGI